MGGIWYQCVQKKNSEYFPGQSSKYFPASHTFSDQFFFPFDSVQVKRAALPQGGSSSPQ